jgi:glucose-6-phosphate 1-epimerase
VAALRLGPSVQSPRWFPYDFVATCKVTVGATLDVELSIQNRDREPMPFEQALHTYFAVGDVRRVLLRGLEGNAYVDKVDGFTRKPPAKAPLSIAGETDRIYLDPDGRVAVDDPVWARSISVESTGSANTVVWNPWIDKARSMADFGEHEWTEMICVETANVDEGAVMLPTGGSHTVRTSIGVKALP